MHRRTPITLLAALMLALALCAPAFAQETDEPAAGDEPAAVEAQGTSEDGPDGEPESGAEASGDGDDSDATNGEDDVNCSDFNGDGDAAQDFYDRQGGVDGGDEDGLDDNDDGMACDNLARSGSDDDSGSTPSGGVDSGAGGMAAKPDGGSIAPLVLGGLAATAALLAVLGVAVRRRV